MNLRYTTLAALVLFSPGFLLAADYYVTLSDLNIREEPSTSSNIVYTLVKGAEVEVLFKEGEWYAINYNNKYGYVNSRYLELSPSFSVVDSEHSRAGGTTSSLFLIICFSLIVFGVIVVYANFRNYKLLKSVTERSRGTRSERDLVRKLLKNGVSAQNIFHDLYVEKQSGGFSQIDVVTVSKVGIIVFEIKDYSGWIFGSGNRSQWTKVLAYGKKKFYFYNPIMQNSSHIAALKNRIKHYEDVPFFSVIVFYGDCDLRSIDYVPKDTYVVKAGRILEVIRIILQEHSPYVYRNETEVVQFLKDSVENGGKLENQVRHIEDVKEMLGTHRVFK